MTGDGRIRCFVCAEIGPPARPALEEWILAARRRGRSLRWVAPENLHVTLKFCGEISPSSAESLKASLREAFQGCAGGALCLSGIGTFPAAGDPRVLWIGIGGDLEKLRQWARLADGAAEGAGVPPERRRFSPHLTLARFREGAPAVPLDFLPPAPREIPFVVSEAILMRSDLRPQGPLYRPLARFPLG